MIRRRRSKGPVLVNQSYLNQRVSGQQRYATEIAQRLLTDETFVPVVPGRFWARDTKRTWAWLQFVLPTRLGASLLLSMTSRAPLWRRRHVLVVHDVFVLTNPDWFSRAYHLTHAPLLKLQLRSAAAVVAVSEPTAHQLTEFYSGPIVVAPNAPSEVFLTAGQVERGSQPLPMPELAGREYFLAVGNQEPRKNLRRLAEAYGRFDEAERERNPLVVVGAGDAIYSAESIEWPSGTIKAGYVSDEQLAVLYREALAVVLVSLAEGFGLPLIEAAAAGTRQLVVSDIPVFRWICGDGAQYVDPLDPASIDAGLRATTDSPRPVSIDQSRFDWGASMQTVRRACLELVGAS